jgi:hypothetical protein
MRVVAQTIVAPATGARCKRANLARRWVLRCVYGLAVILAVACKRKDVSSVDRYGEVPEPIASGHVFIPAADSLDARRRADSLAALNPTREARAAIARGDLRYVALCQLACVVIGVVPDSICLLGDCAPARQGSVITINGAGMLSNRTDLVRLDSIAGVYGTRYNRILREFRSHAPRRLPYAAQSAQHRAHPVRRGLIIS